MQGRTRILLKSALKFGKYSIYVCIIQSQATIILKIRKIFQRDHNNKCELIKRYVGNFLDQEKSWAYFHLDRAEVEFSDKFRSTRCIPRTFSAALKMRLNHADYYIRANSANGTNIEQIFHVCIPRSSDFIALRQQRDFVGIYILYVCI